MSARPASATAARRHDPRHGEAAEFWSRRAGRPVSPETARVITENLVGFVSLLAAWQVKADESAGPMSAKADEAASDQ